mgnify:CR=1 FL=1
MCHHLVASQDCDCVIQKLWSSCKSQVPSLPRACLASPVDRCHGGECNALICLRFGHMWNILMRDSHGREQDALLTKKTRFSACGTGGAASPVIHKQRRSLLRRAANHRRRLNNATAVSFGPSQPEHAIGFDASCRCCQKHWHVNSSRGSIVQLSRERTAPRIAS